ncbi:MAG TPA: sulfotransferase [Acetobacteraceae bacterium]|nr:sulfotransferase [Acetobacteraceae bacterium]
MTILRPALRAVDSLGHWSGLLSRPLSAERLIEIARRRARHEDLGDIPIAEPLERLLEACRAEASLSLVGRFALKWDSLRFLANLLDLAKAEQKTPAIAGEPITRPIFITGFPRSGTTFLHELMLCDPANRAPRVWETIFPYPPREDRDGPDRRVARVARQLRMFGRLAPEFHGLHRISATSPQECSEITAHSFRSLRFDTTYRIPSYRTWLESRRPGTEGHLPAYRMHRRFLQHLQHQHGATRWVLKCPDHVFALDALRAVYPDAGLVFVHRDPARVLLSVARLTEVVRRPFTRHLDPMEIGRGESARWHEGAQRMIAATEDPRSAGGICHVRYLDLIADPAATVTALYRHFNIPEPDGLAAAVARFAAAEPNGGYGVHRYRTEDHGLDADREREKFRPYLMHFDVAPEPAEAPRTTPPRGSSLRSRPAGLSRPA